MSINDYRLTFKPQLDKCLFLENKVYRYGKYIDILFNSINGGTKYFGNVDILFVGSKLFDIVEAANRKTRCLVLSKGSRSLRESQKGGFPSY